MTVRQKGGIILTNTNKKRKTNPKINLLIILILGVLQLLMIVNPAVATGFDTNLIINGNAEQGLAGWTIISPGFTADSAENYSIDPSPDGGWLFDYYPGPGGGTASMYQEIDISDLGALIDAGTINLVFSGYLRKWRSASSDIIRLELLDNSRNPLPGSTYDIIGDSPDYDFDENPAWQFKSQNIPSLLPGTRYLRVTLIATVANTVDSSSDFVEFDGISLKLYNSSSLPSLNATGINPIFTENGSPVYLFNNVTADTNDSGQSFTGVTLTVANVSNGAAEVLTIGGTGISLNNGNTGSLPGVGNYVVTVTSGTAQVILGGMTYTNTQMEQLLEGLTYHNTSDSPDSNSRVVTIREITDNGSNNNTITPNIASTISMIPVNDAPALIPAAPELNPMVDSEVNSAGQTVSSFAFDIIDADSGALRGIAIIGQDPGNGSWQYSLDNGVSWQDVGSVSDSNALLLRGTDRVRFVPDGINGTMASITYRAWDQSGATNGLQGTKVNASINGGITPFSYQTDTATINVTAVNNAPVVTTSSGSATFVEGDNVASMPVLVDAGITVFDSDSPLLYTAMVQITANFQSTQDVLAFTPNPVFMGDITGSYDSSSGILWLTSSGGATSSQWQEALRAVTYNNISENPNTSTRAISFIVDDSMLSSSAAIRTVTVTATNDTPIVIAPESITVTEDIAAVITGISFSDLDAGAGSVTVTLSVPNGMLFATPGGGVAVSDSPSALTLTGSISDINTFIAGGKVNFQTAFNSTDSVTLTVSINDNGLSGGAPKSASRNVMIMVTAVNDAPMISAPAYIYVTEDVPTPLTGISFSDVDAGSGTVNVQFSITGTGTLSASSAGGVTVLGSGTSSIMLVGRLDDINAFIASSAVSFTTASNATANVMLFLLIDDGGNTGAGGNMTDEAAITLDVIAVNDPPVNNVPGPQTVFMDEVLSFSSSNGNAISIADVDAGSGTVQVTFIASNGLISLSSTAGLAFIVGSGSGDGTMTFMGSLTDINNALSGMSFMTLPGYRGPASLQIVTNDLGLSGFGGDQSDSDTINITVKNLNPVVFSVISSSDDGRYKAGEVVTVTVTFDQVVIVNTLSGTPVLTLETGDVDRQATYVSGSGSEVLSFSYTVQPGDFSADLDYTAANALILNGATIRNIEGTDAILTLPAVGGADSISGQKDIVIDAVAPKVTSVNVPANGTYSIGLNLEFTVNFDEIVTVSGTPRLRIQLDIGGTVYANYLSGSGTSALVFRYVVAAGHMDRNGISIGSMELNNGTIQDLAGNNGVLTLENVGSTVLVLVDGIVPTVTLSSNRDHHFVKQGDTVTITATYSKAMAGPRISISNTVISNVAMSNSGDQKTWTYEWTVPDSNETAIVTVTGTDLYGNPYSGSEQLSFVIDNLAPVITIMNPTAGMKVNINTGSMLILAVDETSSGIDSESIQVRINGVAFESVNTVAGNRIYCLLKEFPDTGTHTFTVKLKDKAGNEVTESVTVDWEHYRKGFGFGRFRF